MPKSQWKDLDMESRLDEVEDMAARGLMEEDIAHNLGIHRTTLWRWKQEYPQLAQRLKNGNAVTNQRVVSALYKRAMGYSYKETRTEYQVKTVVDEQTETQKVVAGKPLKVIETVKEMAPDVTAQIYWTKNRMPDQWRDKQPFESQINSRENLGLIAIPDEKPEYKYMVKMMKKLKPEIRREVLKLLGASDNYVENDGLKELAGITGNMPSLDDLIVQKRQERGLFIEE